MPFFRNLFPSLSAIRKRARSKSRARLQSRRSLGRRFKSDDANMTSQIMVPRAGLNSNTVTIRRIGNVSPVYNTNDGTVSGTVVSAGSPNVVYQGFVTLNVLNDIAEFTGLFSQYKITEIEYHIINANYTDVNIAQSTGMTLGTAQRNLPIYMGAQNDLLSPATVAQAQQEQGVIMRDYVNQGKPFILKIKNPTYFTPAISDVGGVVASATESRGWLNTQNTNIAYRGFYFAVEGASPTFSGSATPQVMCTVRARITMQFRGVR